MADFRPVQAVIVPEIVASLKPDVRTLAASATVRFLRSKERGLIEARLVKSTLGPAVVSLAFCELFLFHQSNNLRFCFASAYFLDRSPGSVMTRNPSLTQRESKAVAERGL